MTGSNTENILGYPISNLSLVENTEAIMGWLEDSDTRVFSCVNPHSVVVAGNDHEFSKALHESDLLTPDGAGIVLASKILGGKINSRITGSDIFYALSDVLEEKGGGAYFFLGSTRETLGKIESRFKKSYPNIRFAGAYSPPFKPAFSEEDNAAMIDMINASGANVLWVGMTAPKQEKWIIENRDKLEVSFVGAIGAVFDFYAGNIERSGLLFQRLGLEWLPRLVQEPKRLWKRNFVSTPLFLVALARQYAAKLF